MAQQNQRNKYALQETRLPLIGAMTNRDQSGTKDQRFINIFPETRKVEAIESTKIFLNKRPGLTLYKNYGAGNGRGVAWFRNKFYLAIDGKIWEDGTTPTAVITLTNATTKVGMLVANSSSIGDYLFICDGTKGWVINSAGVVTLITDADFPSPHIPMPTFIDGCILLAKGSDVYNYERQSTTSIAPLS